MYNQNYKSISKSHPAMKIDILKLNDEHIAEVSGDGILLKDLLDGLQFMADCGGVQAYKAILYQENISPDFFELKTRLAGDILQKYTLYDFDIAIVGDFERYNSKSLNDFIFESNKRKKINFVATRDEAIRKLTRS